MGNVYLNPQGNGYAYVDNPTPDGGERFTIHCIPDPGERLEDVRAFDSYDNPVAIPVAQTISMIYRDDWRSLYVDIYFSGSEPPPGPTHISLMTLICLLTSKKKRRRYVR